MVGQATPVTASGRPRLTNPIYARAISSGPGRERAGGVASVSGLSGTFISFPGLAGLIIARGLGLQGSRYARHEPCHQFLPEAIPFAYVHGSCLDNDRIRDGRVGPWHRSYAAESPSRFSSRNQSPVV